MTFGKKIFIWFYGLILLLCCAVSAIAFWAAKGRLTQEYLIRYNTLGGILAESFQHMESLGDQVSLNALLTLKETESARGMPSDAELDAMAKDLGVTSFYIIDEKGKFLRSSDLPVAQQSNSFFDFCEDYRLLLTGDIAIEQTPILPAYPVDRPSKFTMIPNAARKKYST